MKKLMRHLAPHHKWSHHIRIVIQPVNTLGNQTAPSTNITEQREETTASWTVFWATMW